MSTFQIEDKFYLDGEPFKIISGAIHYFRVVPEYWRDRLEKLKAMGCNCVETYIPWNFHEPEKGRFLWSGMHDVEKFISTAEELGLYVIIRPSPYICAEWEFGGLPAWLLAEPGIKLRCCSSPYLDYVEAYYKELMPRLVPHQLEQGGKIILMQIENEYGYFGNDTGYLEFLADTMRQLGITVPFVTSDGPYSKGFIAGQLPGALATGNFGSAGQWQFSQMKKMGVENKPLMNMEFWCGWFDAWGNKKKKTSSLALNKMDLDYILKHGNVNFYMFHGGTNFGFMNGGNYYGKLTPDTTSYDYDAPLSEDGSITPKYQAFKEIISKYRKIPEVQFTTEIKKKSYGKIKWSQTADLFENLEIISSPVCSLYPLTMEEAGQNTGYIVYRSRLKDWEEAGEIIFEQCADRVQTFADGKKLFTAFDKEICSEGKGIWPITFREGKKWKVSSKKGAVLDFLIENMGRVNFGHSLEDQRKGIGKGVLINGWRHFGWEIYRLPLDETQIPVLKDKGRWQKECSTQNPAFFKFDFEIDEACDTFLDFDGWGKGCVWVNGFNIGRFWEKGPQKRLYIPGPLLKKGSNEIIVFETEGKRGGAVELCDKTRWS